MSDNREPYSVDEKDAFSWVDDELDNERPVEEEILEAEDYRGANRHGTTPSEEQTNVPLDEALEEERPDEPAEQVTDEWEAGPDPQTGTLVDNFDGYAEETEAPAEDPAQGALHETGDDRERAGEIRESWEAGPPADPEADLAPTEEPDVTEDLEPEPEPEDWRLTPRG
ncbi:hypothetical protein GCM10027447_04760 [Glycomyces halotolerans]